MLQLTAIRLLSVIATIALVKACPNILAYQFLIFAIALGHYALSYAYSRQQIVRTVSTWRSAITAAVITAVAFYFYSVGTTIVWVFGVHHALNETFILDRFTTNAKAITVRWLRGAGFAFNLALFCAFCRRQIHVDNAETLVLYAVCAATVCYGVALLAARRVLSVREIIGHTAVETVGLALLYASFGTSMGVMHIASYHFIFWGLFPAAQMADARRYRGLAIYTFATVAVTAAFVAIAPVIGGPVTLNALEYKHVFNAQSFIHFGLAFLLSRTNPRFVVRAAELLQRPVVIGPAVSA